MDAHVGHTRPVESRITLRTDDHGPGDSPQPGITDKPAQVQVKIDDVDFYPAHVGVPHGTTGAWVNAGIMPHQIMGAALAFEDSILLHTGETVARTFTYLCVPHRDTIGTITVRALGAKGSIRPKGSLSLR